MSNRSKKNNHINVNLDMPLGKMQIALQHLSDFVVYSQVAASAVGEKEYTEHTSFFKFWPAKDKNI